MRFPIHTAADAPDASRETLAEVKQKVGMVPRLAAGMAHSPTLLRSFFTLRDIYAQGTLTAADIQVLSLANAFENGCTWCMAFHSFAAEKAGVPPETIAALRAGGVPPQPRWRAMVGLTREMIARRGRVNPDVLAAFERAGLGAAEALQVVLGIGFSVMANYSQHLIGAPLDEGLKKYAWEESPLPASP